MPREHRTPCQRREQPALRRQVINQLAGNHEDGAGIERQEADVQVGPPDEYGSITPRERERQEPHALVGPPGSLDQGQDSMTPRQRAVDVARKHMKVARTDVELHQAVHTLAFALGATRVEEGTLKALHAVLFQMDHPLMSDKEAFTSKGASLSNFKKWRRAVLDAQLGREKGAALTYEYYTPARPRRVRQPERQLSCQPSCQPSQQLQTDVRPTPGPAGPLPAPAGSVYNSTSVTQATVRERPAPHPHLQQYAPSRMSHSRTRHPHPYAPPEWRVRQEACPPPLPGRVKEPFRVASWKHRAPGKISAPPTPACLSAKAAMPPPPPRAPARLSPTAKAEAERFVSQSLETPDTLELMTTDEAIDMVMPLIQPQVQPASPCSTARARAETAEGSTPAQNSKEGKGKSYYTDLLQNELDRFAAAEELQPTTIEAAMPPPPPLTVAPPSRRSATGAWPRETPIVLAIVSPMETPNELPIAIPIDIKPMPLDLSPPPPLLPSPQTRLASPGAPPPALAPATAEPPATAAPFRASELLARAAEFRTQASELLTRVAEFRSSLMESNSALPA